MESVQTVWIKSLQPSFMLCLIISILVRQYFLSTAAYMALSNNTDRTICVINTVNPKNVYNMCTLRLFVHTIALVCYGAIILRLQKEQHLNVIIYWRPL